MTDENKSKKEFPDVYERLLPFILILMAIVVVGVLIFAMIVGLGIV